MYKRRMCLLAAVFCLSSFGAIAKELDNGKMDRQGFFLGFGVGGGAMNLRGAGSSQSKSAVTVDLKIGGGLNEKWLLMYDGTSSYAKFSGVNFYVYNTAIATQWFAYDNFYVRPGIGFSIATASLNTRGATISTKSKVSFGADLAGGYEFRLGKRFALSPEAVYHYSHIRSSLANGHVHVFGVQVGCNWYF